MRSSSVVDQARPDSSLPLPVAEPRRCRAGLMLLPSLAVRSARPCSRRSASWPGQSAPAWPRARTDDEDAAIALWSLYELSYRGFDDVDDGLEWEPGVLALRRRLERDLEDRLRGPLPPAGDDRAVRGGVVRLHRRSRRALARGARAAERHRRAGARPAAAALDLPPQGGRPDRVGGAPASRRAKAALVELLYDEYGAGDPNRLHAHLFAQGHGGRRAAGGVRRVRRRGAGSRCWSRTTRCRCSDCTGAGAARPWVTWPRSRRPARCRRGGWPRDSSGSASRRSWSGTTPSTSRRTPCTSSSPSAAICGALVEAEPTLADDVFFGAFTCLDLEDRVAGRLLTQWGAA